MAGRLAKLNAGDPSYVPVLFSPSKVYFHPRAFSAGCRRGALPFGMRVAVRGISAETRGASAGPGHQRP